MSLSDFQLTLTTTTSNLSSDRVLEHDQLFHTPVTVTFWYIAFMIMLCFAIFGNILIIWIIVANRRMQSVTNYFLFNLSLADLTMASLNGAPNFVYMIQKEWIFGTILCMVNNFVATLTVASCVFTMTAISIDRYLAIIQPLKPRMTRGLARKAIGAIWLCSVTLALPSLIFSETVSFPLKESKSQVLCILRWPDQKNPSESNMDLGYNICLLFLTYILPIGAMALCYGSMSRELWGQNQIGESTQRQSESLASKRKIVRMFIVIVTTFGICWFPYHAYFIYQYYDGSIVYEAWAQNLYLSCYWLAMSTSMINPIVYYSMNSRFRACIRKTASRLYCYACLCRCCGKNEENRNFGLRRRDLPQEERETPCSHSSGGTQTGIRAPLHQKSNVGNHSQFRYNSQHLSVLPPNQLKSGRVNINQHNKFVSRSQVMRRTGAATTYC